MNNPFELINEAETQIAEIKITLEEIRGLGLNEESTQNLINLTTAHELARTELMKRKLELLQLLVKVVSILPASERVYRPFAGICDYHVIDKNTIRVVSRDDREKDYSLAGNYSPLSFISTKDLFSDDLIKRIMSQLHHYLTHAGETNNRIKSLLSKQTVELKGLFDLCKETV